MPFIHEIGFKLIWYIWNCFRLQFVGSVLKTSVRSLQVNFGPFIIVAFGLLVKVLFCILYFVAYLRLYKDFGHYLSGMVWSEILIVLYFCWAYQVLMNILAVTVAGSIGMLWNLGGVMPSRTIVICSHLKGLGTFIPNSRPLLLSWHWGALSRFLLAASA